MRPPAQIEQRLERRLFRSGVGLLWSLATSLFLWWLLLLAVERLV
jgi:hypothetical protein